MANTTYPDKNYTVDTRSSAPEKVNVVTTITADDTDSTVYQLEQINTTLLLILYQLTLLTGEDD
jgi:hypothetical protein